jgi:adenylate cyclase
MNMIELEPYITSISVVGNAGSSLAVFNVPQAKITHFQANPDKPLPQDIKYVIRTTDKESKEKWDYLGSDGKIITTEQLEHVSSDPKNEAWYQETKNWPHLRWSQVHLNLWREPVLTASLPVMDQNKKVFAVIGVNISLNQLSNFFSHLKVAKTGSVFIVSDGQVVIPPTSKLKLQERRIPYDVVELAFAKYSDKNISSFTIINNKVSYFVHFTSFPLSPETKWLIETIIPFEDFFADIMKIERQTILLSLFILIFYAIVVFFASKQISQPIVQLSEEVDKIQGLNFEDRPEIVSHVREIATLQSSITSMRQALKAFSVYVPKGIVQTLMARGQGIKLGGERKEMTVMFTDVSDFTTASEALRMNELTKKLSSYFNVFSHVILKYQGTIDKYIGDSIMAFWGAPMNIEDHADLACSAALDALKTYKRELARNPDLPSWDTRVGIHTGEVVVGNIGTNERMNYTAIGNTVNTAARLQNINKVYQTHIIVSEGVLERAD